MNLGQNQNEDRRPQTNTVSMPLWVSVTSVEHTCLQELYSFAQSSFTELFCALIVQVQTQVQTGNRLPKEQGILRG